MPGDLVAFEVVAAPGTLAIVEVTPPQRRSRRQAVGLFTRFHDDDRRLALAASFSATMAALMPEPMMQTSLSITRRGIDSARPRQRGEAAWVTRSAGDRCPFRFGPGSRDPGPRPRSRSGPAGPARCGARDRSGADRRGECCPGPSAPAPPARRGSGPAKRRTEGLPGRRVQGRRAGPTIERGTGTGAQDLSAAVAVQDLGALAIPGRASARTPPRRARSRPGRAPRAESPTAIARSSNGIERADRGRVKAARHEGQRQERGGSQQKPAAGRRACGLGQHFGGRPRAAP